MITNVPKVGNVLKIKGVRGDQVVIEAGWDVSRDELRGDQYSVFKFETITVVNVLNGYAMQGKSRKFSMAGGSMRAPGSKELEYTQIELLSHLKIRKTVSVQYSIIERTRKVSK